MDALQKVFDYQGVQVRTVVLDGEPYFVAKDVCEILELGDVSKAVSRLDADEKGTNLIPTPGGNQEMLTVNEPGLYTLVLASRKKEARKFKRWITHEVLPALRKTGTYSTKPLSPTEALLQAVQILAEQEKQIKALSAKVETVNHRVDTLDAVNVIGNMRQRLNAMIRKYAYSNGFSFSKGYKDFVCDFNNAYHTNLSSLMANYVEKHHLKEITIPDYLEKVDRLEDALRVADKMLNLQAV